MDSTMDRLAAAYGCDLELPFDLGEKGVKPILESLGTVHGYSAGGKSDGTMSVRALIEDEAGALGLVWAVDIAKPTTWTELVHTRNALSSALFTKWFNDHDDLLCYLGQLTGSHPFVATVRVHVWLRAAMTLAKRHGIDGFAMSGRYASAVLGTDEIHGLGAISHAVESITTTITGEAA